MNPQDYVANNPQDLIGSARKFADKMLAHVAALKGDKTKSLKLAFRGKPGCGKTSLVDMIAKALASERLDIESINGRNVTIETVRDWQRHACYGSMFGGWKVKVINEMDLIPLAAQELLLTYLDELPAQTAVLGTTNADCATLSERFETRFQLVKVTEPTQKEIFSFLMKTFKVDKKAADFIAMGCAGNVRLALKDAGTYQMLEVLPEKREAKKAIICSARSAASHKAWDTMRQNQAAAA